MTEYQVGNTYQYGRRIFVDRNGRNIPGGAPEHGTVTITAVEPIANKLLIQWYEGVDSEGRKIRISEYDLGFVSMPQAFEFVRRNPR